MITLEKFRGEESEYLRENTEKYIAFQFQLRKKMIMMKESHSGETITYLVIFINSCRFMQTKLSNLVDNLPEINNKDCKTCIERKKY